MKRVSVNGLVHALPFADLLRPLTEAEAADLRESVRTHGVKSPVVTYLSDLHGRSVLDGANRAEIAAELDLEVPTTSLGRLADDLAEQLAYSLNADRRHLTVEERAVLAAGRRDRVAAARAGGESTRAIAEREGVSREQVRRDLKAAGDTGVSPAADGKIRGRDGKCYPTQPAGDTPEKLLERTRRALDRVIEGAVALADSEYAADLLAVSLANGVPLKLEGGACVWPTLSQVRAALADLAARAAAG